MNANAGTATWGGGFIKSYSIPFVVGFLICFDTRCLGTAMGTLLVIFDFSYGGDDTVVNATFRETAAASDVSFGGDRVG